MDRTLCKSFFLLIGILAGLYPYGVYAADIETIASNGSEYRFRFNIPSDPSDLFEEIGPDSSRQLYSVTLIAIPPGGSVQLVSAERHKPTSIASSKLDRSVHSGEPHQLVRIMPSFRVRGRQLAALRVYPVSGSTIHRQVEVQLHFHGGSVGDLPTSADPSFDRIFQAVVANYDQMSRWPTETKRAPRQLVTSSFTDVSEWYCVTVDQSGLYEVTGAQLQNAGMILTDLDSDDIHLFNGGGRQLEVPNDRPRPDFREVAIIVEDGNDGVFDHDDHLLFYGESVNRWWYGPFDSVGYHHHHYTESNIYWLTVSESVGSPGLRMTAVDGTPDGTEDTVFTSFRRHVHSERDTIFSIDNSGHLRDFYRWFWTDDLSPSFYIAATNVVAGPTAEVRVVAKLPFTGDSYTLQVSSEMAAKLSCDDSSCTFAVASLREGLNQFRLTFSTYESRSPFLDYVNVMYQCELTPVSDRLEFNLVAYDGPARIELVDGFSQAPMILDIGDPLRPRLTDGYVSQGGLISFAAALTPSHPSHFYATTSDRTMAPASISKTMTTDLRSPGNQTDLIIITTNQFTDAMQEYIDYRQAEGVSIRMVTVEDIIENFAYGLFDPVAIRDYLKFAYENYPEPAPSMVLLVGDGHFDFLNHFGDDAPNYVPPFIHPYDNSFAYSDDNYVYFGEYGVLDGDTSYSPGADRGVDMISARWTVRDVGEIHTIIDKTQRYESPSNFGLWRTEIALVADDEFAGRRTSELVHTGQTDTLQMYHLPRLYSRDKIYAIEHPFVNSRKPSVNDAIVNAFNAGRLVVNYVGHGNPGLWAHERIFTIIDDLPRLTNTDRLPLVLAASCAIGAYDGPGGKAMAEELITSPGGGAIAVVSATRLVWATPNRQFNQTVYDVLFDSDKLSMCETIYTAKLLHQLWAGGPSTLTNNDRAFIFIGDPLVKLARPQLGIRYLTAPDSLVALRAARVSGEIVDEFGNTLAADGFLTIRVYDSDKRRNYNSAEHGGTGGTIEYAVDGAGIYRGTAGIEAGRFDFEFMPPLDIGFGGRSARIMTYATFDTIDAAGIVDSIYVIDSIADVTDSIGPSISYQIMGRKGFVSGDPIQSDDHLEITLSDSSGINLAGGLGHGVTLEIDGRSDKVVNLTSRFEYDTDNYTRGSVGYALDSLTVGRHNFKIKAWDNANNSASTEFAAEIVAADGPAIVDLLNYPNPMQDATRFSFYAARQLESFSLEIFTLSGRKIKSYSQNSLSPGYHDEFIWRGEDFTGDRVATGVYIYKATARSVDDREPVEMFGKVVVVN